MLSLTLFGTTLLSLLHTIRLEAGEVQDFVTFKFEDFSYEIVRGISYEKTASLFVQGICGRAVQTFRSQQISVDHKIALLEAVEIAAITCPVQVAQYELALRPDIQKFCLLTPNEQL